MSMKSVSDESAEAMPSADSAKCQICCRPSHGLHFGAETCRACAAFFRRFHIPLHPQKSRRALRCRQKKNDCQPRENGKWYCKKCRLEKCTLLGMRPDNIQLDRDLFSSVSHPETSKEWKNTRKRSSEESASAIPPTISVFEKTETSDIGRNYVDLTYLMEIVSNIFKTPPVLDGKTRNMNTLERLAFGLEQVRRPTADEFQEMKCIERMGKEETIGLWEQEITKVAKWLMYCDSFVALSLEDKFTVVKCMWHLFNRLERIAMTADMRREQLCSSRQFVISRNEIIDFDKTRIDVGWISDLSVDNLMFFLGPISTWFNDQQVDDFIDLQPSDMELTFLLCNLCFQLTGKRFNGSIEEYTERMQEDLANDLHKYYVEADKKSRYSHRLVRLLSITKDYQRFMHRRKESAEVGSVLNAFKIDFSHPEMFRYSC